MLRSAHTALFLAQAIGSMNSIATRAVFAQQDPDSIPTALTFAVWRALIASATLTLMRCFLARTPPELRALHRKAKVDDEFAVVKSSDSPVLIAAAHRDGGVAAASPTSACAGESLAESATLLTPSLSLCAPAPQPTVRQILRTCALGYFVVTLNYSFFFFGVALTDAITLAAMMCFVPPLCFVLGYALGFESFSVGKALSTVLIVTGNFLMAQGWTAFVGSSSDPGNGDGSQHQQQQPLAQHRTASYHVGVACLLASFTCWSLYLLFQRSLAQVMHMVDFLYFLYWSAFAGLVTISVFHPLGDNVFRQIVDGRLSAVAWGAMVYSGCVQSILTYFLVSYGTCKADSSLIAALYNGIMPLMITVEAIVLLGESVDQWQVVGGAVVVCGWLASLLAMQRNAAASSPSSPSVLSATKDKDRPA